MRLLAAEVRIHLLAKTCGRLLAPAGAELPEYASSATISNRARSQSAGTSET
jgi:hypothetical protein